MSRYEVSLAPSVSIPLLGMGTWKLQGKPCEKTVRTALEIGYRHIDTAHFYENHREIREAIRGFPREKLFLTSKFTPSQLENETIAKSCGRALKELGIDYLDLYLIHWPDRELPMKSIAKELEQLQAMGKIRAWGVSNFTIRHLKDMIEWGFSPAANQVEFHPYLHQKELLDYCNQKNVRLIAYRSLGMGALVADPIVEQIAENHGKTVTQVLLRWAVEKQIPVIPKATSKKHLEENFAIFDFKLKKGDVEILDNLTFQHRFCQSPKFDFDYQ
ncbi:MAG: putative oxidoreductase [Chlamydiae bacterium]|nr:putative oxidoreductase [Chlamydiota bacterium]